MEFRFRLPRPFEVIPPDKLWPDSAQPDEDNRRSDGCPEYDDGGPIAVCQCGQGAEGRQDKRDPFCLNPQEHFEMRINCSKRDEDSEMQRDGAGHTHSRPKTRYGEKQRRDPQEQAVESKESAAADETLHFAAEEEEHVHFERKPEKPHAGVGCVHKCVGYDLPDMPKSQDLRAVENKEVQKSCATESREEAG